MDNFKKALTAQCEFGLDFPGSNPCRGAGKGRPRNKRAERIMARAARAMIKVETRNEIRASCSNP